MTTKEQAKRSYDKRKTREGFQQEVNERTQRWRRENPAKMLLSRARCRAKALGLDFNLCLDDIIIPEKCPLLNTPIYRAKGVIDNTPSLDRKDNTKGYTKDNIWVISYKANRMKNTASIEELTQFSKNWILLNEDI